MFLDTPLIKIRRCRISFVQSSKITRKRFKINSSKSSFVPVEYCLDNVDKKPMPDVHIFFDQCQKMMGEILSEQMFFPNFSFGHLWHSFDNLTKYYRNKAGKSSFFSRKIKKNDKRPNFSHPMSNDDMIKKCSFRKFVFPRNIPWDT